jgi:hypothetical protein
MAVELEFIHLFIPMTLIDEYYPGGWPEWKRDHDHLIGGSAWFDEHLYTQGAMNGADIDDVAAYWKQLFSPFFSGPEGASKKWDKGVLDYFAGKYPDTGWYLIDTKRSCAYLTGEDAGEARHRDNLDEVRRYTHPDEFPARPKL